MVMVSSTNRRTVRTDPREEESTFRMATSPWSYGTDRVDAALQHWQMELLDLTRNNRLLHVGPRSSGFVRIMQPDINRLYDLLTGTTRKFTFYRPEDFDFDLLLEDEPDDGPPTPARPPKPPRSDELVADGDPRRIELILNRLRLRSRSLILEQGVQALFVALGALEWSAASGEQPFVSPLILLPVRLERKSARDPHTLSRTDETPIFNPALARKIMLEAGVDLSAIHIGSHNRASAHLT